MESKNPDDYRPRVFSSVQDIIASGAYERTVYHFKNPKARAKAEANPALLSNALRNSENVTELVKIGAIERNDVKPVRVSVRHRVNRGKRYPYNSKKRGWV